MHGHEAFGAMTQAGGCFLRGGGEGGVGETQAGPPRIHGQNAAARAWNPRARSLPGFAGPSAPGSLRLRLSCLLGPRSHLKARLCKNALPGPLGSSRQRGVLRELRPEAVLSSSHVATCFIKAGKPRRQESLLARWSSQAFVT